MKTLNGFVLIVVRGSLLLLVLTIEKQRPKIWLRVVAK